MAHRIVSIEGEGDYWTGVKLADSLVRKSRIFWTMAKKIQLLRAALGSQKYHRLKTAAKLKETRAELKLLKKEFDKRIAAEKKAIKHEADKRVREIERKIVKHDAIVAKKDATIKLLRKREIIKEKKFFAVSKRKSISIARLMVKARIYDKYKNFFTRKVTWHSHKFMANNELWIRYILALEGVKINHGLDNAEYYVLLSSLYFDYVTAEILINRSGWGSTLIHRAIRQLIEKGLMYREVQFRYIPSEKGIALGKEITYNISSEARKTYFTESPRPRKVIEDR